MAGGSILQRGPTVGESLRFLLRERTALTLVLSAIGVLIVIAARWDTSSARANGSYYNAMKIGWHHEADMVISGDSRILIGVFPASMQEVLPDMRILNYGFGGQGYTEDYLRALEEVLDPESERKTIVLGVTAISLTEVTGRWNSFVMYRNMSKSELRRIQLFGLILPHLYRMNEWDLLFLFRQKSPIRTVSEFHSDGSLACRTIPEDPVPQIAAYETAFDDEYCGKASPRVMDLIFEHISRWTKEGISVYAFRPPTHPQIRHLEDERSGFREKEFAATATACGATWLVPEDETYHTYDGSHLHPTAARRFSLQLARQILDAETAKEGTPDATVPPRMASQ